MNRPDPAFKKRQTWGLWNRYFLTNLDARLAKPWTRLFVAAGLTPNMVSLLSLAASLTGMALVALGGPRAPGAGFAWAGGALLMLGLVWDHSDGQVARTTGRGSPGGALLDTVLDRWVETGWAAALAVGAVLEPGGLSLGWPEWTAVAAAAWAVHATLYVRWANIQRDLYVIQKELRKAKSASPEGTVVLDATPLPRKLPDVRTFYLPFAFNRDVTLWMLLAITFTPWWVPGLLAFAALHTLLGLEKNWYTFQDLRSTDTTAVRGILDPDYHK